MNRFGSNLNFSYKIKCLKIKNFQDGGQDGDLKLELLITEPF